MIGALGVVVIVNVGMAVMAHQTFPGLAVEGSFRNSNMYSLVLQAAERQAALGWSIGMESETARPALLLHGRDAEPLNGAQITATANRPMGTQAPVELPFHAVGAGHYEAQDTLPLPGQWDLMISITHNGETLRVTRRVIVR